MILVDIFYNSFAPSSATIIVSVFPVPALAPFITSILIGVKIAMFPVPVPVFPLWPEFVLDHVRFLPGVFPPLFPIVKLLLEMLVRFVFLFLRVALVLEQGGIDGAALFNGIDGNW